MRLILSRFELLLSNSTGFTAPTGWAMTVSPIRTTAGLLLTGLADLIWPRICLICGTGIDRVTLADLLCDPCRAELVSDSHTTCSKCSSTVGPHSAPQRGCPRCSRCQFHFESAVRLGTYEGHLRQAVIRMKEQGGELLAEEVGRAFAATRHAQLIAGSPQVIVPVPLHWRRTLSRGYNQSEAVARSISRELRLPMRPRWLIRVKPTVQRSLSATARWENVRGAFRVGSRANVRGVRVLLVDDVLTTGATADAAATALRDAGAAQVTVAVVATR